MDLHKDLANALRVLSVDCVQAANSGHPGMPLGMADIAAVLWIKHLRHNPLEPGWLDRDRFILSNGHGSALLYSLLHLSGYDFDIDDLKQFRQLSSKTPGHPELMPGIETTTGPLGQGLANAVGMALAEKLLALEFNTKDVNLIDHYTYVFVGDGCLMEGVSHEACSFAGHNDLSKLIVFWDDNSITIDGDTSLSCSDDVEKRFLSYGWQVIPGVNGHDFSEIDNAILKAKANNKPTLIACKTEIGWGSSLQGTAKVHGAPLDKESLILLKNKLGLGQEAFAIPNDLYAKWCAKDKGRQLYSLWEEKLAKYQQKEPEKFLKLQAMLSDFSGFNTNDLIQAIKTLPSVMATRKASNEFLKAFAKSVPGLIGGSADLTPSVLTDWPGSGRNYINYGVREFGMFAIMSGLALHKGFLPFGGTFLTFIDYGRSALRMSAMMSIKQIYVLTHDSIGLGEDGPTHQPVEHLSILRATPGIQTWRPCDVWETFVAWNEAIKRESTTALILSRQNLPTIMNSDYDQVAQGAYVCWHKEIPLNKIQLIIIATGSEVHIAIEAAVELADEGIMARVVSMPSMEQFMLQSDSVKDDVLPRCIKNRIAVEAASTQPWWFWVGDSGRVIGIDSYGASAPANKLFEKYGFSRENIVANAREMLELR